MATKIIKNCRKASITLPYSIKTNVAGTGVDLSSIPTGANLFHTFPAGNSTIDSDLWTALQNHNSARFSAYYDSVLLEVS